MTPQQKITPREAEKLQRKKIQLKQKRRKKQLFLIFFHIFIIICIILIIKSNFFAKKSNAEPAIEAISASVETPVESELEETESEEEISNVEVGAPVDYSLEEACQKLHSCSSEDDRYEKIYNNRSKYPEKLLKDLANNPEMLSFVSDFDGIQCDSSSAVLTEQELASSCPLFLQFDKRWGYHSYGDSSMIAMSGCGPTALSMVIVGLTHNQDATPTDVADFAMSHGYYMSGTGTSWNLMSEGVYSYGVSSYSIGANIEDIIESLNYGALIICSMKEGDFTTGGHFIVIYGCTEDGFQINDPFCIYKSKQIWSKERLCSQIKAAWAFNKMALQRLPENTTPKNTTPGYTKVSPENYSQSVTEKY